MNNLLIHNTNRIEILLDIKKCANAELIAPVLSNF